MQYVSATEAKQRLAAIMDAAQIEPVMIKRQNREVAVLLSPREYDRLRGINISEFEEFCDRVGKAAVKQGLTENKLARLMKE
ncbi:type II toxin-antitoxin system Phd/YefM family antitoxin [Cardiobacterium sp. AH-315-I02]|nr:type II toxin-antitoxin system Phd/YefM family antitoxin [Cardiobacterium sp. AH-315-I02]